MLFSIITRVFWIVQRVRYRACVRRTRAIDRERARALGVTCVT